MATNNKPISVHRNGEWKWKHGIYSYHNISTYVSFAVSGQYMYNSRYHHERIIGNIISRNRAC